MIPDEIELPADLPLPQTCEHAHEPGHVCEGGIYFGPRCHPGMPTFAGLAGDVLSLECSVCGRVVGRLRVTGQVVL